MHRVGLYLHTVRYLRPIQIAGRLWKKIHTPLPHGGPAPQRRMPTGRWKRPARRIPSMVAPMTFRFLNETLPQNNGRWGENASSQLWRYNLHYFDDLNAFDAESRRQWHVEAVQHWIEENSPGNGDAWAPFPTSLRVVNWIKWALGGTVLEPPAVQNLGIQVRALTQRLEYHLLGNHLFGNAKALVFAGLFFEGPEAERWLERGMTILAREMPEQILEDGGQFERSPMYHALALEDVLDLINVTNAYSDALPQKWTSFVGSWAALAEQMRAWLMAMCHPDGEISFFNDAATGVAPAPAELERYAKDILGSVGTAATARTPLRLVHLAESGYVRADVPHGVLLMDVAPIGPDYLPGHAHADTLSFELSLFGQRVIVNGGTSCYGTGPEREAERSTAAHSTVTVNGENSSEVWSGFRVARRARPFGLVILPDCERLKVSCAHDGYRRLAGQPLHRRTWIFQPGVLRVEDCVEGGFKSAVTRFHLHPMHRLIPDTKSRGFIRLQGERDVRWEVFGGSTQVERSFYCPEFGRRETTQCLAIHFEDATSISIELKW